MTLLLSIANAAADVVPGLAHSPLPWEGHLPPRRSLSSKEGSRWHIRSRSGSGRSSSASSSLGDFYRLPWYRRPLRSPPLTAAESLDFSSRRSSGRISFPPLGAQHEELGVESSVLSVKADGDGDRDTNTQEGVAEAGGGVGITRDEEGEGDEESSVVVATPPEEVRGEEDALTPVLLTVEAAPTPERQLSHSLRDEEDEEAEEPEGVPAAPSGEAPVPPPAVRAPTPLRQTEYVNDNVLAGEAVASSEEAVVATGAVATHAGTGTVAVNENVIGANEDVVSAHGTVVSTAGSVAETAATSERGSAEEVRRLKAEVDRLKREMAAMAAANANGGGGGGWKLSRADRESSPRASGAKSGNAAMVPWQWAAGDGVVSGSGHTPNESSAALATPTPLCTNAVPYSASRPKSTRLRADDSWMQRRRSGEQRRRESGRRVEGGRGTGEPLAKTNITRRRNGVRRATGSVLPEPGSSDGGSDVDDENDMDRAVGPNGNGGTPCVTVELSPPRNRRSSVETVGPSPASGDKTVGGGASGADDDDGIDHDDDGGGNDTMDDLEAVESDVESENGESLGTPPGSSRGGGRGGGGGTVGSGGGAGGGGSCKLGSGHRDITARPLPVFFPNPEESAERSAEPSVKAAGAAPGVEKEVKEKAAAPVATPATPTPTATATTVPSVPVPPTPATPATPATPLGPVVTSRARLTVRRRESSDGDSQLWRWVLAQRTENLTVRQAVISHGLPPLMRRRIWAAWAGVATSST